MGGFAVVVDWGRRVAPRELDAMLALVPHRTTGVVNRVTFEHCALAGTATAPATESGPHESAVAHLAIVGDFRLWNRDGLRSRAGGQSVALGMSDPRLVLEAYRRTGVDCLDDVNGDFAFVIWDDREQRVVAVRDRFAAKPLFFERTPTGFRFASEPKQLVATSERDAEPCVQAIGDYITGASDKDRLTFFEGIERVRPSMAFSADPSTQSESRYWNPDQGTLPPVADRDILGEFRERLVNAVDCRLGVSDAAVSQLSGGLDSSAIAASAHVLADGGRLPAPFHTVSAVFPGHAIDESEWIDEITSHQPFAHHEFVPHVEGVDAFDDDMWVADQPRVNRIRDMWTMTAAIGGDVGADAVFTGIGGDQILSQDQFILDRFRSGSPARRVRDMRVHIAWTGRSVLDVFDEVSRDAIPSPVKKTVRRLIPQRASTAPDLMSNDLWDTLDQDRITSAALDFDYPSPTQSGAVAASQHASLAWINEAQEAEYASRGIGLSQPYLDRDLVEFVASISIQRRPYDGRSKALTRAAFAGLLPKSVLDRRTKTVADEYLNTLLAVHGVQYRERYPEVSEAALPYLDNDRYVAQMNELDARAPGFSARESLWSSWTLMAWLDGLGRYREWPRIAGGPR